MVIVIKTIKRRTDIKNISIIGKTRCTDENVINSSLPSIEIGVHKTQYLKFHTIHF